MPRASRPKVASAEPPERQRTARPGPEQLERSTSRTRPGRPGLPVTPDVIRRQVMLEEIDVAPDGETVVFVRRHISGLEYRRHLWSVPVRGGRPRQLTAGPRRDSQPRHSPDGRWLAYLSTEPDPAEQKQGRDAAGDPPAPPTKRRRPLVAKTQVWIMPAAGGRARRLTSGEHDVDGFSWSPDSTRICFWGWQGPARFIVGERRDGKEPTARRIMTADWRWDWVGFQDRRTHLSVIRVRGRGRARATRVTAGDFDVSSPAWDADGRSLVFTTARHALVDMYPRPRVYRVPADGSAARDGGEPVEVARLRGLVDAVDASPDGHWLALVGNDEEGAPDDVVARLFLAPTDGSRAPVELAPDLDLPVGSWQDTDLHGWTSSSRSGPFWVTDRDGSAIVMTVSERGRSRPWRFPFDPSTGRPSGRPSPLGDGDATCWQLSVAGGRICALGTLDGRAMEVMEVVDGGFRTLTGQGSRWQRRLEEPEARDLWIKGPDGPIETWLFSPPGARSKRLPLVLDIHGGPIGAWSPAPSLEVSMLVSAGYRVALPNIRGSAGYGREWIRSHMGTWGESDAGDVMAVVDRLIAEGVADRKHVGLIGLSYGGFMTQWLIGAEPDRFSAAVADAGVTNNVSSWAGSDSGPDYDRRYDLGEPLDADGVERLWRSSPLRLAPHIRAPLLILQGADDARCPASDNEQLFVALRALGRTVEYVLYPESYHYFGIAGRPDRRIDRHERMLDWFRRYL